MLEIVIDWIVYIARYVSHEILELVPGPYSHGRIYKVNWDMLDISTNLPMIALFDN